MADDRASWLEQRRAGMGGSDVPQVVKDRRGQPLAPWADEVALWLSKTDPEWPGLPMTDVMQVGVHLEEPVARWYAEHEGVDIDYSPGIVQGPEDWILGSPDLLVPSREMGGEIKVVGSWQGYGPPGSDILPAHYIVQPQWYMLATGLDRWDVIVLRLDQDVRRGLALLLALGGSVPQDVAPLLDPLAPVAEVRVYHVQAHRGLQDKLRRYAGTWWERHVVQGVPPLPRSLSQVRLLHPRVRAELRNATADEVATLARAADAERAYKAAKDRRDQARVEVAQLIGEAEGIESPDLLATFRERSGSTSWKAVAQDLSTLARDSGLITDEGLSALLDTHTSAPGRTFSVRLQGQE